MPSDVEALNQLYYVDSATPVVGRNLLLRFGNIDLDAQVNGVSDRYFKVKGLKLEAGIAFSESDARRQAQVVVIDRASNALIGSSRYYDFSEGKRDVLRSHRTHPRTQPRATCANSNA